MRRGHCSLSFRWSRFWLRLQQGRVERGFELHANNRLLRIRRAVSATAHLPLYVGDAFPESDRDLIAYSGVCSLGQKNLCAPLGNILNFCLNPRALNLNFHTVVLEFEPGILSPFISQWIPPNRFYCAIYLV